MAKLLLREVELLKKLVLNLSAQVEKMLHDGVRSVAERDEGLARQVIEADARIDQAEVEIEEECLKTLALHQPVAIDLRLIVAVLKINNDLERIGDLAVNLAERAIFLLRLPAPLCPYDFAGMAARTESMVHRSIDALVSLDTAEAREVIQADREVDQSYREACEQVKAAIRAQPGHLDGLVHLLSVARHLERIADHATNIAEDVVYMIDGEIVRHHNEESA